MPSTRAAIVATAVVVAIGVLAGGGWWWYSIQQRKTLAAWAQIETRLFAARSPRASTEQRTAAIREVEQFLLEHPSSKVTALAAYDLGNLRFAVGQYAAARAVYDVALARAASATLRTLTRSAIAATWEAERDFARAADSYQALLRELTPRDFLYEQTLVDLGRVQELSGRRGQAVETYQRLLRDVPGSPRTEEVRMRLANLAGAAK